MNFRTTLILMGVLAAALVFVFVANRKTGPDTTAPTVDTRGAKVLELKSEDVEKVVVHPASGSPLEMVKEGAKWKLVQPVAWPADEFEAGGLVSAELLYQLDCELGKG